jgi:DNA-binding phage protein
MENGRRKLTVEQVLEARWRYMAGERELTKLARDYGVSRESLKSAVLGFTFKDLPMPPKRMQQLGR